LSPKDKFGNFRSFFRRDKPKRVREKITIKDEDDYISIEVPYKLGSVKAGNMLLGIYTMLDLTCFGIGVFCYLDHICQGEFVRHVIFERSRGEVESKIIRIVSEAQGIV